ncbi:2-hydroxyglutaryl-CoA dehydratase [bacterium]|nr:2-hydroxyglutaryl-CoA dehydratase [bacterium]
MRLGIDIGSRYTKVAYPDGDGFVLKKFDTMRFYREFGRNVGGDFLIYWDKLGISKKIDIVATGYGRERAKLNGALEIPEIQAHSSGAMYLSGKDTFTLTDIGGQDVKVVRVEDGVVVDFYTSDRCAASTGRFLENMAQVLNISLEELSRYKENPVKINSTCAVFAETELLDKISRGISIERLAAGVNYAAVRKFAAMMRRFPLDEVIITGGVSKNKAVVELLSEVLGIPLNILPNAMFAGAIGCVSYKKR